MGGCLVLLSGVRGIVQSGELFNVLGLFEGFCGEVNDCKVCGAVMLASACGRKLASLSGAMLKNSGRRTGVVLLSVVGGQGSGGEKVKRAACVHSNSITICRMRSSEEVDMCIFFRELALLGERRVGTLIDAYFR
jgi:hypothetical protein